MKDPQNIEFMHVYTAGLADIFCGVLIFVCRRAVLRKWKEKEGLRATYIFVNRPYFVEPVPPKMSAFLLLSL